MEPLLEDVGEINLNGIDWVIVGGESGEFARPMEIEWAENILAQCREYSVPFFFKQMSGKEKATRLDIPEHLKIREFPK
jgi:protein gp37